MKNRIVATGLGLLLLATAAGYSGLSWAQETPTTRPAAPERRMGVDDSRLRDLFAGSLDVYLEGQIDKPFVSGATYVGRERVADKEFLLFEAAGERYVIRTERIAAVRIKK